MKRFRLIIFSLIFLLPGCAGTKVMEGEYIPIDLEVINNIDNYKKLLEEESRNYKAFQRIVEVASNKAELTAIFNDDEEIKKMTLTYFERLAKKQTEYIFLDNDYLLYVNEHESQYYRSREGEEMVLVKSSNNEFYFDENKLVFWIRNNEKVPPEVYSNKSAQIFSKLGELLHNLSEK